MRRVALSIVVMAITFGGPVGARQTRPDFSGTWNSSSSRITLKQDARTLAVTEDSETRIYNLDGSESRMERAGDKGTSQRTSRARWVQSALVIETRTVSNIGTWTDLEVFSLDYGPQLSVVRVYAQTTNPMMGTTVTTYKKG